MGDRGIHNKVKDRSMNSPLGCGNQVMVRIIVPGGAMIVSASCRRLKGAGSAHLVRFGERGSSLLSSLDHFHYRQPYYVDKIYVLCHRFPLLRQRAVGVGRVPSPDLLAFHETSGNGGSAVRPPLVCSGVNTPRGVPRGR